MKEWICRELSTSTGNSENGVLMREKELIRCKDCRFLGLVGTVWKCQNRLVMMLCEPNDFCSRAERKEK